MVKRMKRIPQCILRTRRRVLLCLPLPFVLYFVDVSLFWISVINAFLIVGAILLISWLVRRERRLYARLIEADYALCANCLYDLRGRPKGSDNCPECGRQFDPSDWQDFKPIVPVWRSG